MFGAVAPRYDLLNTLLSAGRDRYWRKTAVDRLAPQRGERFLDVATGTADMAVEIAARQNGQVQVLGIDFSAPMLERGRRKVRQRKLEAAIALQKGCGENLPYASASFDGLVCAFGIRNFADPARGLSEMLRVLKPDGRAVILEFSHPEQPLLGFLYNLYFRSVLPRVGRLISKHKHAYDYLPQSVSRFPKRKDFADIMQQAGFARIAHTDLTLGIVTLYEGCKQASQ